MSYRKKRHAPVAEICYPVQAVRLAQEPHVLDLGTLEYAIQILWAEGKAALIRRANALQDDLWAAQRAQGGTP